MLNKLRQNPSQQAQSSVLKRVRKNVYKQALLAGLLIVLTVVILFAVTAAWYTNILQTDELVFKASKWSFNGTVQSADVTITAEPGDWGVVELTAINDGDSIAAVSLNVSRAQMDEEMQKRIYFYIDTSKTRNGEAMERIYLGNSDSYTYTLFPHATLTLNEEVQTDAALKWHWVYDVLGYYVQGTWDGESMNISEYLRPIEYDYDEATTTFETDTNGTVTGSVVTVDGKTTLNEFLYNLSLTDGYKGTIDTTTSYGGYYPVAVDETTQTGVWAYLCTYSEIQVNTAYDTYLGENANRVDAEGELVSCVAKLTLSAQNSNMEPKQVNTAADLLTSLSSGEAAMVQLGSDLTLSEPLTVGTADQPQQVILDLNGNTLTVNSGAYSSNGAAIQLSNGSSLTMTNGGLAGNNVGYAIEGTGVDVTLDHVKLTNVDRALYVRDNLAGNTLGADSTIHLSNCEIETNDVAVFLSGNGDDSAQATQLIVEDSTIISKKYIGISFNGSANQWGTSTQIIHSEVYGYYTGIYHPQGDAVMTISDGSVISGYTGLVLKGGSTTVTDSTIHGTGALQVPESVSMSGFNDTGDGIYIETNYGWEIQLQVSGNSIVISDQAQALRIYPESDNVSVSIDDSVTVTGAVDMQ